MFVYSFFYKLALFFSALEQVIMRQVLLKDVDEKNFGQNVQVPCFSSTTISRFKCVFMLENCAANAKLFSMVGAWKPSASSTGQIR